MKARRGEITGQPAGAPAASRRCGRPAARSWAGPCPAVGLFLPLLHHRCDLHLCHRVCLWKVLRSHVWGSDLRHVRVPRALSWDPTSRGLPGGAREGLYIKMRGIHPH